MRLLFTLLICVFGITTNVMSQADNENDPAFATFEIDDLVAQLDKSGRLWTPFFEGKNVLTGIYRLKEGATDRQQPHDTDEVYYVASGRSKFTVGDETVDIKEGSILFVKAHENHQFSEIEEDLVLVVFFDQ